MMKTVRAVARARKIGEVGVPAQGLEGLLGTVGGRGQPVGAQADPRQDGDEGQLVEERRVLDVLGPADQGSANLLQKRGIFPRSLRFLVHFRFTCTFLSRTRIPP